MNNCNDCYIKNICVKKIFYENLRTNNCNDFNSIYNLGGEFLNETLLPQ